VSRSWNVVVNVASELPYPATAGNRIRTRTLNLALLLAPRRRITFIAHRNGDSAEASRFLHERRPPHGRRLRDASRPSGDAAE